MREDYEIHSVCCSKSSSSVHPDAVGLLTGDTKMHILHEDQDGYHQYLPITIYSISHRVSKIWQ